MQARPIKTSDIWAISRILNASRTEFLTAVRAARGQDGTYDDVELFGGLLLGLLGQADAGIRDWLADLAGVTPEELDEADPVETLDLIESLTQQDRWPDFFARLRGLFGKFVVTAT